MESEDADLLHRLLGRYTDPLVQICAATISAVLCIIGFIPRSFLSDEAYIWMQTMPAAKNHKLMVGRHAKAVVAKALAIYPKIIGHCFHPDSARWLRSLGATVSGDTFEIRRA